MKFIKPQKIPLKRMHSKMYIDGLVQDCSISIANALEILQSCTKPSIGSVSHFVQAIVC